MASTTHAAARRQAAEQRNAAAWPLPLELLPLVVAHLARETWPAVRLACKQLEAALAPHVHSLSLARWPEPGGRGRLRLRPGLACVATLEVPDPAGDAEWRVLQQLPAQLPALRHLRISRGEDDKHSFSFSCSPPAPVAASWVSSSLAWLELPYSYSHMLPAVALLGLRVARLNGGVSAGALAAFAPRLQQLSCDVLELQAAEAPGAVLEVLTHLYALNVEVPGAGSVADGVVALRRALPALAVLACAPVLCNPSWSWFSSLDDVLLALPSVTAVRRGNMANCLARLRASSLGRLEHLAMHVGERDARQQLLAAVPHMQRLASLTLLCAPSDSVAPMLRALAALPALASLVLPMRALCEACCPGVHAALPSLVGSTSLVSLEFVVVLRPGQDVYESMQSCEHAGSCTAGASVVRAAAAQRGAPLQRLSLQREMQRSWWVHDFIRQAAHGEGGVWGAFGPVEGEV